MYYVESGTDDGQSTVVMSESTIESTHLGNIQILHSIFISFSMCILETPVHLKTLLIYLCLLGSIDVLSIYICMGC